MRRSKQWRQVVGDGWNEVGRFSKSFRRKPTEVLVAWKKIRRIILERSEHSRRE